jgi:PAS domain S-box-containing protein
LSNDTLPTKPYRSLPPSKEGVNLDREQYRLALKYAPTGIALVSLEGRFLTLNDALCELLGYAESELIGVHVVDITHIDDVAMTQQWLRDIPQMHRERARFEKRYIHKTGRVILATVEVQALFDTNEKPQYFIAHINDITEYKRAEEALRESEERFRIAFDNAPTGMSIITAKDGAYLAVNPRLCAMFGYEREELLGGTINLVTHPDDIERSRDWIIKKMKGLPCEEDFEKRFIHKDGHVVWALVRAEWIRDRHGHNRMAVAHILDITQRKLAEFALIENQRQLRDALDVANLGYWTLDVESSTLNCDEGINRIIENKSASAMIALDEFKALVILEERAKFENALAIAVENEVPFDQVIRLQLPSKTQKYVRIVGRKETMNFDAQLRIKGILQDVTSLNEAERERARLEAQLQRAQRMEALGHLTGGIAHDFNNLLTTIGGNAALAQMECNEESPVVMHLSDITTAVESAANLTRQLLTFARQQVIYPKVLNLNTVVERVRKMLIRLIGEDLKLVTILEPNLRRVRIDVGQAEQILLNLSVNARDAMPDGGTLTIETANVELDEEYCRKHAHASAGSYVMLSISDNGTGMTQETKNNLFVPFFTTKELGRGTGLGLSIVYGAVRQNDGFIDVYSEMNLGTTFKIYLPCVSAAIESIQPKNLLPIPSGRETILLVEDDAMVRAVAYRALVSHGYRVHAYPSGDVALTNICRMTEGFDLIVTDVIMPGINGRVLVEKLRETYGSVLALYTSGYTENIISCHGLLSDDINFLAKPYSIGALVQRVRTLLDRKKQ